MTGDGDVPTRDGSPSASGPSIPQKRALDEDHTPAVSSPLNPDVRPAKQQQAGPRAGSPAVAFEDSPGAVVQGRDKPSRAKKDSLKKRESKAAAAGATLDDHSPHRGATPDPKNPKKSVGANSGARDGGDGMSAAAAASPLRYKLAPPKQSDFEPARGPVFMHHHNVPGLDGSEIEFLEPTEHVYNKKSFHYTHCIADPGFPASFYYRQTEPEPHFAHMSYEDMAAHMFLDQSGRHITTNKGFRMARANVAVREGRWYWEVRVTRGVLPPGSGEAASGGNETTNNSNGRKSGQPEARGHVRVGLARREASLDAPVGFDAYSYGIRDVSGQTVHMSRPKDFFPPGEHLCEGDVLGIEISLPSERLQRKVVTGVYNPAVDRDDDDHETAAPDGGSGGRDGLYGNAWGPASGPNIVRDRIPIRFKQHIYFEIFDYHTTRELEDLMNPSPALSTANAFAGGSTEPPNPHHQQAALRTLPGSSVRVYRNGVDMGVAFADLFAFLPPASRPLAAQGAREGLDDGEVGYYPAVSVFRGGAAEVNFGPDFWFPPADLGKVPPAAATTNSGGDVDVDMAGTDDPAGGGDDAPTTKLQRLRTLRPLCERYEEQIAEDIVFDIIDEVDFWMQDGGRSSLGPGARETRMEGASPGQAAGRGEIRELVQEDD